eukprot:CAMPEP_0119319332 /NCGR_PEP_ID=MMETSP1333-20130426/49117_1 /TAXON_ID=418940 /ORGANISM="Scyphosphaera apsteinii, Strain RCC1455" /LENGTH=113 /DNA_ID=CAMNT_0007325711 /DNA_START=9 /DNA_END=350 /DNA_ORIENTATION=+
MTSVALLSTLVPVAAYHVAPGNKFASLRPANQPALQISKITATAFTNAAKATEQQALQLAVIELPLMQPGEFAESLNTEVRGRGGEIVRWYISHVDRVSGVATAEVVIQPLQF